MKFNLYLIATLLLASSCSASKNIGVPNYGSPNVKLELADNTTFKIEEMSEDKSYGYDRLNPIMVGGASQSEGPLNERRFLNALAGPNGEVISYKRLGSCCEFKTKNGMMEGGLLDKYSVTYEGLADPIILYLNMYDADKLKVPVGFTLKK